MKDLRRTLRRRRRQVGQAGLGSALRQYLGCVLEKPTVPALRSRLRRVRAGSRPADKKRGPGPGAPGQKWTRTQRIRTAGALPFEVLLVDAEEEPPVYQRIASKALHLRELGLSDRVIAQRVGVSDKTVGKAIRWLGGLSP